MSLGLSDCRPQPRNRRYSQDQAAIVTALPATELLRRKALVLASARQVNREQQEKNRNSLHTDSCDH